MLKNLITNQKVLDLKEMGTNVAEIEYGGLHFNRIAWRKNLTGRQDLMS